MEKGDKYEYNTMQGLQYIMQVISFDEDVVFFRACNKEDGSHAFDYEMLTKDLNDMIKRNNIGKL